MKIIYFITTKGHGLGGHFYSLKSTILSLNNFNECVIINIGKRISPAFNNLNVKIYYVNNKHFNPFSIYYKIKEIVKFENPDIIHGFDQDSFFFANLISHSLKIPLIMTKCGGPNPKSFYPKIKDLIVFSDENYSFFIKNKKFDGCNIFLIPNRIIPVSDDFQRIAKIKQIIDNNSIVILRISRITNFYRTSIIQSINLIKRLREDQINAVLILIGSEQDPDLFQHINNINNNNIFLLTDPEYSVNANELIEISDIVIGTGRSFMEAASKGKIMLVPLKKSDFPLLVSEENFLSVFNKNFSERIELNYSEDNYRKLVSLLLNDVERSDYSQYIKEKSKKYFLINPDEYIKLYSELTFKKGIQFLDMTILCFYLFKINWWR